MKAIVLEKPTKPEELEFKEIPIPNVVEGRVLVKIEAFGLNYSEVYLRNKEILEPYIKKPIVPGIECVGTIENPSDSNFKKGDKVICLMGGMGRSFNGSYAEYSLIPSKNIFKIDTTLSFEELAAIPETFFTAYGSLFENLQIKKEDTILIQAGTSSLGIASIQLAKAIGAHVITTIRNPEKTEFLKKIGADEIYTRDEELYKKHPQDINKILDLIGPSTLKETMKHVKPGGIVCSTGILGGLEEFTNFNPIADIPNQVYLTGFHSNFPTQEKINKLFKIINKYKIKPHIDKIYQFKDIQKAHSDLENHIGTGKKVIKI